MERNLKGWRIEGLIPFNRNALWKKRESMTRSSTGHSAIGPAAAAALTPAALLAPEDSSPDDDPAPENPLAPVAPAATLAFGVVTERVQEAMDFIIAPPPIRFDEVPLAYEQIVAHNLRLQETCKVFADFLASSAERPRTDKSRITAKTMFGLKGSATGEEGRRMARARNEEQQAEKAEKAKRKEAFMQKKALDVAALVTKGAELLLALERHGPSLISRLVIADILALLTNANPQGNVTKPKNKTEGLDRVRALGSVQAALSRHALAIAVEQPHPVADQIPTATPVPVAAVIQPPPPFPSSDIDIGGFLLSLGSFESPGVAEHPSAPVGPEPL